VPAVRPYWKGYIKLALVSCPIGLWTASSSGERVAFRQINKKTGNRLRQQLVDDETREPVEAADIARQLPRLKASQPLPSPHKRATESRSLFSFPVRRLGELMARPIQAPAGLAALLPGHHVASPPRLCLFGVTRRGETCPGVLY
jgi:hypothetical protein